jgi:ketosteroid isomerase-like protein
MDDLSRLVMRDAIRALPLRYALAVDGKDLDGVARLFVPDVDNGSFGLGRDGVRRFYDQSLRRFHCSMHVVANHVIDLDDAAHAHGIVYCQAYHHVPEPEHWFDEALAYFDTYERIDGEWLFRRRRLRSWYRQYAGHPELGNARVEAPVETSGPKRGARMPEAFPTFETFWSQPPVSLPAEPS